MSGGTGAASADICVVTPYPAHSEPRGPRHARAWAEAFPRRKVLFVDCAAEGASQLCPKILEGAPNLSWRTHRFATRRTNFVKWLTGKARQRVSLRRFRRHGALSGDLMAPELRGLRGLLAGSGAAIYHVHKWEAFLPLLDGGVKAVDCVFDCMEFYSEMGEGQTAESRDAIRRAEARWLPECRLLTTSSPEVSGAYQAICSPIETLSLYNCPSRLAELTEAPDEPLRLYWRNSVVALSQRGLEDALDALVLLPKDVTLHVQGHLPSDGGRALLQAVERRGLSNRVAILGPHEVDGAVDAATGFNVGLCLERDVNTNHRLTVSNKMFDYHMAGLAVVSSDLPGLRTVIEASRGGLLYRPGQPASLAACIARLKEDKSLLPSLRGNARRYALTTGNCEFQMNLFAETIERRFSGALAAR